jgi:hypothetical protein
MSPPPHPPPPTLPDDYYTSLIQEDASIKEKTKYAYLAHCKRIVSLLSPATLHDIIFAPKKHAALLRAAVGSPASYKTYLAVLLKLMSISDVRLLHPKTYEAWSKHVVKAKKVTDDAFYSHESSDRQRAAHVDWLDILRRRDALLSQASSSSSSRDYLLMCMVTMLPPRRQLDWARVRVYTQPSDKPDRNSNYIVLHGPKPHVSLVEYKTSRFYGRWAALLPVELVKVLLASLKAEPREYLFTTREGQRYDREASFTKWSNSVLKRVLGNDKSSMNTLRHAFASHIRVTHPKMSVRDKMQLARALGHSMKFFEAYSLDVVKGVV